MLNKKLLPDECFEEIKTIVSDYFSFQLWCWITKRPLKLRWFIGAQLLNWHKTVAKYRWFIQRNFLRGKNTDFTNENLEFKSILSKFRSRLMKDSQVFLPLVEPAQVCFLDPSCWNQWFFPIKDKLKNPLDFNSLGLLNLDLAMELKSQGNEQTQWTFLKEILIET